MPSALSYFYRTGIVTWQVVTMMTMDDSDFEIIIGDSSLALASAKYCLWLVVPIRLDFSARTPLASPLVV